MARLVASCLLRQTSRQVRVIQFLWDEGNVTHIALHDITPTEAEQVIRNEPVDFASDTRKGEERLTQLGKTNAGRYLVVVSILRGRKVRVVTAWPAKAKMRKVYEIRKAELSRGA